MPNSPWVRRSRRGGRTELVPRAGLWGGSGGYEIAFDDGHTEAGVVSAHVRSAAPARTAKKSAKGGDAHARRRRCSPSATTWRLRWTTRKDCDQDGGRLDPVKLDDGTFCSSGAPSCAAKIYNASSRSPSSSSKPVVGPLRLGPRARSSRRRAGSAGLNLRLARLGPRAQLE